MKTVLWKSARLCRAMCGSLLAVAGLALAWVMFPFPIAMLTQYPASTLTLDREGRVLRGDRGEHGVACRPVRVEDVGPWIVPALVATEDKRFFRHSGVDPLAVGRALLQNIFHRRIVSGASTISTQVVRLIEPRPRTVRTKCLETFRALQMERRLTKPEILAQYLNRAPFGSDLVGIEAASARYFGKSAGDLSLAEAALLAGLPQSPSRLRPDRHPDRARKRRDLVLERMRACGFISREQLDAAQAQAVVVRSRVSPFGAPHFCDWVAARRPGQPVLRTTLDARLQQIAEDVLRSHAARLVDRHVFNGAVVILDVRSGAVRAMVGSPDFWDDEHAGQVNGAVARRSPGSALKPFVYAMAMDQGQCTPGTVTADVPVSFTGYRPENFDREFCGLVTVREALVRSLNIPALRMTALVGQAEIVHRLRQLGLSTLDKPPARYGLGIALGSGEVTLIELANAYACLARLGEYRPLRAIEDEPTGDPARLFSVETAYLIADMLSGEERAFDVTGHAADAILPRVAWKTGTSAGFRDAWTVAWNPEYVVGVWLGNHDGRGAAALVGHETAAPLAYEVFRRLYPAGSAPWFRQPEGIACRPVCACSGAPPGDLCGAVVADVFIPGVSATTECPVHRRNGTEVWPVEVEAFLRGQRRAGPPSSQPGQPLRIASPSTGAVYCRLTGLGSLKQEIPFAAVADGNAGRFYWFVDAEPAGQSKPGETFFWPLRRGDFLITCSDDLGRRDSVTIRVE